MDLVKYTAQLDLTDNGCFDTGWRIKQGDYGNSQLMISLVDNGVNAFDSNVIPQINFKRPDGKSVLADMTVEQNVYSYIFAGNELEIAGTVLMDVKFITPQGRISSASCKFTCVEDTIGIDTTGASTYYNPVSEAIEEAKALAEEVGGFTGAIEDLRQNKQNKLIAGRNITIDEETNVISASGGGGGGASAAVDVSYDNTTTQMPANNVQDAIDEVFHSVGNGKELIASAISDKGIPTLATDTFAIMAQHIAEIEGGGSGIDISLNANWYTNLSDCVDNGFQKFRLSSETVHLVEYDSSTRELVILEDSIAMFSFENDHSSSNLAEMNVYINGISTETFNIPLNSYIFRIYKFSSGDRIKVYKGSGGWSCIASCFIKKPSGSGGGGTDVSDTTAIENDVKLGKIFHLADGSRALGTNTDVDVSDTTATADDVMYGKYFFDKDGDYISGTYTPRPLPPIVPIDLRVDNLEDRGISASGGGYSPVTYGIDESEKEKIIPENIKKDVEILGVTGTFEGEGGTDVSDTTASESDVLLGKIFHKANGDRAVGTYEAPKLSSGQVRLSTSASTNINCGFKPKVINVLMGSSYTAVGGVQLDYVESISTSSQWVSGNSNALPTTTNNRIGSINENGFTLTKVSDTRYSYCTYYVIG